MPGAVRNQAGEPSLVKQDWWLWWTDSQGETQGSTHLEEFYGTRAAALERARRLLPGSLSVHLAPAGGVAERVL